MKIQFWEFFHRLFDFNLKQKDCSPTGEQSFFSVCDMPGLLDLDGYIQGAALPCHCPGHIV